MITKDDLQRKLDVVEEDNQDLLARDRNAREKLSEMLSCYETETSPWGSKETKVITQDWANIYFELGKLVQKSKETLDYTSMIHNVEFLMRFAENVEKEKQLQNKDK